GSRDEPSELAGSSHFLEHLLFKGTEKRTASDIARAFDSVGGEANAFSAKEYTCLHARVLDEDLSMATDMLSDMLRNPAFRPDEVESERKVILEEIAMHEDTPDDLVHDIFAEVVLGSHELGRAVMGTIKTVGAIPLNGLRHFHDTNYHSRNIVVAAAGNVDNDDLVGLIESFFPPDDRPTLARVPALPSPPARLRMVMRSTEQAHLVVGGIGYSRQHPDRFAWGVLDSLLGGGMSSRLFQEIREKRGLAYSIFSYRSTFSETGLYGIYAGTTPGNVLEVLRIVTDELDRLVSVGITEEELERAKGHMRGGMVLSLEDSYSRMGRLGKSELVHGEILSVDELIARVDAVTLEDVGRVSRDLLRPEGRVLALIGPLAEEDFSGWVAGASAGVVGAPTLT
ncbi:MAG: M16 family metallopeptidase, partial [Candidatus Methylomirabilales bacterium]